ncbi:MAG: Flp pilus assembly protein CpaB [Myxococcales bacterium]|nr:Flp pilus assembly protein CpaB [Myxococcales bacterium]
MKRVALLAAAVLGAASLGLSYQEREKFRERVSGGVAIPVLVAGTDIPAGVLLNEDMLVTRNIPESYVEARHIRASEAVKAIGIRTTMGLRLNESVLWTDLASSSEEHRVLSGLIKKGMRAVTVRIEGGATLGGLLRPGDRIDLLLRASRDDGYVVMPLLQNVLVLAVGSDMGRSEGNVLEMVMSASDLTLSVTVQQAGALTLAQGEGSITASLRNPNDILVDRDSPITTPTDIHLAEKRAALQGHRRVPAQSKTSAQSREIEHVR